MHGFVKILSHFREAVVAKKKMELIIHVVTYKSWIIRLFEFVNNIQRAQGSFVRKSLDTRNFDNQPNLAWIINT